MCLICDVAPEIRLATGGTHAFERRTAEMAVAIMRIAYGSKEWGDDDHLEALLINAGFSRVEIKDMRVQALAIVYAMGASGLMRRLPRSAIRA